MNMQRPMPGLDGHLTRDDRADSTPAYYKAVDAALDDCETPEEVAALFEELVRYSLPGSLDNKTARAREYVLQDLKERLTNWTDYHPDATEAWHGRLA